MNRIYLKCEGTPFDLVSLAVMDGNLFIQRANTAPNNLAAYHRECISLAEHPELAGLYDPQWQSWNLAELAALLLPADVETDA